MYNILVCDDEKDIVSALKIYLTSEGYKVYEAYNGEEALELVSRKEIHLVLMDVMMPVMDGITAMVRLREKSNVPVIMLTAKSEDTDKVLGLNIGADDYITKPFSMRELLARVRANIRRRVLDVGEPAVPPETAGQGGLVLNPDSYAVYKNGVPVELTQKEFDLLRFLMSSPDKVFSREALMEEVWKYGYFGDMRTVDVTIRRLREKIEDTPGKPRYIMTRRGVGYYFSQS